MKKAAKKPPAKRSRVEKKTPAKTPEPPSVVAAVDRDLAAIAKLDSRLAKSALAATATALARELDSKETSATSKATCARALVATLTELRAQLPMAEEEDSVDELSDRRAARLARRPTA